ncbi:histidine phosphatase family protein [Paenibacillus bouchesdurhonensis]|uniref:histidine phosphatase family protein n=1 Tax=Paenibacillus bouchesdurhonensis TaxID=1870990 RepID=UPI000DA5FCD5|nr:histidine phosphatase family protein [Paenibacillus bouchesdurhonensis]
MEQQKEQQKEHTAELWLARHGRTSWNKERRYQGHSDMALLDDEASGLCALEQKLAGIFFTSIYCSDLLRCRQTLERVRPDLAGQAIYEMRLREMNFGQWEGQTYEELKSNPHYRAWIDDPQSVTPPEGEAWEAFERRVAEMVQEWANLANYLGRGDAGKKPRILAITHGGVISLIASMLRPEKGFWDTHIDAGGILRLQI